MILMKTTRRLNSALIAICLSILVTACATGPRIAEPGPFETKSYTVNLPSQWNALPLRTDKNQRATVLTKDGPRLNAIYLFSDMKPGDALYNQVRRDNPVPKFALEMSDFELIEMVTDSLERGAQVKSLETQNVRPDTFSGNDALRFDMTGTTVSGLDIAGEALLAVIDGKFNLILFMAPAEYYADKYRAEVDAIFSSVASGDLTG
ncbi:hypothetical protein [Robiginitomaculum antarcticum]|uniref:hypothetical protein n=1 Tax=Robiginitomaculum antarcticum TaxID=437507 RepID=UPI0003611841|nr:hypothetical protein [Robiginitomaculum antarcticum]